MPMRIRGAWYMRRVMQMDIFPFFYLHSALTTESTEQRTDMPPQQAFILNWHEVSYHSLG